jgi:hypothetical protein
MRLATETSRGARNERNWPCCRYSVPWFQLFNTVPSSCTLQLPIKLWNYLTKMAMGRSDFQKSIVSLFFIYCPHTTCWHSNFTAFILFFGTVGWPGRIFRSRTTCKHQGQNGNDAIIRWNSLPVPFVDADFTFSRLIWRWFRISSNLTQWVSIMSH